MSKKKKASGKQMVERDAAVEEVLQLIRAHAKEQVAKRDEDGKKRYLARVGVSEEYEVCVYCGEVECLPDNEPEIERGFYAVFLDDIMGAINEPEEEERGFEELFFYAALFDNVMGANPKGPEEKERDRLYAVLVDLQNCGVVNAVGYYEEILEKSFCDSVGRCAEVVGAVV